MMNRTMNDLLASSDEGMQLIQLLGTAIFFGAVGVLPGQQNVIS